MFMWIIILIAIVAVSYWNGSYDEKEKIAGFLLPVAIGIVIYLVISILSQL